MTTDDGWVVYLAHLEVGLDWIERSLLTRDHGRVTAALAVFDDRGRRDGLPPLPPHLAEWAIVVGNRMERVEDRVLEILARFRSELALLSGMTSATERPSLFVDEPV
jgi:hypothetical protein